MTAIAKALALWIAICAALYGMGAFIAWEPNPAAWDAGGRALKQKQAANVWDHVDDALAVIELARAGKWHWCENFRCKYIELRIDMRDGGCLIKDKDGNRIDPAELRKQLEGKDRQQWEPWPTERPMLGGWQLEAIRGA